MKKKRGTAYGVIGLGRFGTALAIALSQAGKEVIAVDRSEEKIKNIRRYTDYAFVAENLGIDALREIGIQNCDVAIICIGEKVDVSILTTMSALELGVPHVIAKATSEEFAGSNWDADDYDDWCVIQRDLRVDAGLLPAREEEVVAARNKAAKAIQALFRELGLPEITDEEVEAATYARGSQDMPDRDVVADLKAATDMLDRGVTGIDFVKALYKGGFEDVAESISLLHKSIKHGNAT